MMNKNNLRLDKHVFSAREDYIWDEGDDDIFLFQSQMENYSFYCIRERQRPMLLLFPVSRPHAMSEL